MRFVITFLASFLIGCSSSNHTFKICGENACCKKSFNIIIKNHYDLATDNLCKEGKKLNSLDCKGSLRWCE